MGKYGRRLVEFFIYVKNYVGGWLEFHGMVHALPNHLDPRLSIGVALLSPQI